VVTQINTISSDGQFRREVQTRFGEPVTMPPATVATINTLYPAPDWAGSSVFLSDGASGKIAVSDGAIWEYADGTPV
jgi:hypothetical protein